MVCLREYVSKYAYLCMCVYVRVYETEKRMIFLCSKAYTSGFHMRLPHCVAIFYNLPWFYLIKVSSKKSQRNSEKRMRKPDV
jgi:hypothetical protein